MEQIFLESNGEKKIFLPNIEAIKTRSNSQLSNFQVIMVWPNILFCATINEIYSSFLWPIKGPTLKGNYK